LSFLLKNQIQKWAFCIPCDTYVKLLLRLLPSMGENLMKKVLLINQKIEICAKL